MSVALVTGGNRGIGLEVCRQLQAHGFTVVLGSRDPAVGEVAASSIDTSIVPVWLDVTEAGSVSAAAEQIEQRFDALDVLVNNAAIDYDVEDWAVSVALDRVERALQANLFGAWRVTQAVLPLLRRSAHPRIVNVSSQAGAISEMSGGIPAYAVSKAALNALTRLLAGELEGDRVLVNATCPGWTATDMGGGGRPVSDGAASVVWAALLDDDGPTGGFFRDGEPLPW